MNSIKEWEHRRFAFRSCTALGQAVLVSLLVLTAPRAHSAAAISTNLAAPAILRVAPEPDRTISIWWTNSAPPGRTRGVTNWCEFELYLDRELWQGLKAAHDSRKRQFVKWRDSQEMGDLLDQIAETKSGDDSQWREFLDPQTEDKLRKNARATPPQAETPTALYGSWRSLVKPPTPRDPGTFDLKPDEWVPLDLLANQGRFDRIDGDDAYARLNLGGDMPAEKLPYKFRMRLRRSDGQASPWTETATVRQRNPGYLVWSTRACYRGRYEPDAPVSRRDNAYAMNVYDQSFGVKLAAAKDEFEPYQVFFKNDASASVEVTLELTPLRSERGCIETWAMYPYSEAWIAETTGREENRRPRFPLVLWTDPLAPQFNKHDHRAAGNGTYTRNPATCLPGLVAGWWIDIKVPGSTPAGIYRGTAALVLGGKQRIEIPVELTVWDFFLPRRRTLSSTFGDAGPGHRAGDYNRWLKLLQEHRAGGYGVRAAPYMNVYDPDPAYDGDETLDSVYWDHYIEIARPYVDGSLFEDGVPIPKVGVTGWYVGLSGIPKEVAWSGYTGNGKASDDRRTEMQWQYLREFRLIAKRMGFLEKLWFYEIDEPGEEPNAACTLASTFFHIKKAIPEAKCMVTSVLAKQLRGWITAYDTNPTALLVHRKWFYPRTELGEEYWFYNAFTFLGDGNSHMNERMVPWYGWRLSAANWLLWITCYTADWNWFPEMGGDGLMVYPMSGPAFEVRDRDWAPNIQLKLYREGMEDIELCELATRAVGYQEMRKIIEPCSWIDGQDPSPWGRYRRHGAFRHYAGIGYNADPRFLYQARQQLAEIVMKHGQPAEEVPREPVADLLAGARKLLAAGLPRQALFDVKKALLKDPANLEAGLFEAECCEACGMPEEAKDAALRAVRRNDRSGRVWQALGDLYARMSRFEDAHDCWKRALALDLDPQRRKAVEAAIAASIIDGALVATGSVAAIVGKPDASTFQHIGFTPDRVCKWPQVAEGAAIYRGIGLWGGVGTLDPTPAGLTLTLVRAELSGKRLPKGATIRRAYIRYALHPALLARAGSDAWQNSGGNLAAYAVLRPWNNEFMSWFEYDRDKPWAEQGCGKEGLDRGPLYAPAGSAVIDLQKREVRLDITRIARDWAEGRYPNCGLAIIPQAGNLCSDSPGELFIFYSM